MEERIIDDEYGRGIRLKKTKDGYVDVTDELAEKEEGETCADEAEEEVAFEFPVFEDEEDDEDLVALSPEEALQVRREKEEMAQRRRADYEQACQEGEQLLSLGSFKAAELKYKKALKLDDEAVEGSVGYWRAKTCNFTSPDILIDEYADAGIESLEYDLGVKAVEKIKKEFAPVFKKRLQEIKEEEKPLAKAVEEKMQSRRQAIGQRLKKALMKFTCVAFPTVVLLVLTIVFGLKNFTTSKNTFIVPTAICGVAFFVCFIVFIIFSNNLINLLRLRAKNERLSSTEDGAKLVKLRDYKQLYGYLALPSSVDGGENQPKNVAEKEKTEQE